MNCNISRAALFPLLSFAFVVVATVPEYSTSDDITMRSLIEGIYNSNAGPSEHVVFLNILYSKLLASFYSVAPNILWYDAFLVFFLLVSWSVIGYVIFSTIRSSYIKILLSVILFAFSFVTFISLQYTAVSGICATSSVLAAIYLSSANCKRNAFLTLWVPAGIIVSGLLRFNEMLAILALASLLILCTVVVKSVHTSTSHKRQGHRIFLAVLCGLTISCILKYYHNHNPGTQAVLPYKKAFNELFDYASPTVLTRGINATQEEKLREIGWSATDYHMLISSWYFTGEGIFDIQFVENIDSNIVQDGKRHFLNILKTFSRQLYACGALPLLILLFLLLPTKRFSILLASSYICFVAYITLICIYFKEPSFRVIFPMQVFLTFFLALKLESAQFREKFEILLPSRILTTAQIMCCLTVFLVYTIGIISHVQKRNNYSSMIWNYPFEPSKIYFYDMDAGILQPYKRASIDMSNKITFTWHQMLPEHLNKMKNLGLFPDFWQKVCYNDNFRFLVGGENNNLGMNFYSFELLGEFIAKEYGLQSMPVVTNTHGTLTEYSITCTQANDNNF